MEQTLTESEKVEQQNKLIAEFMGYYFNAGKFYSKDGGRGTWFKEAKYDTDWNRLMEVVRKIEDLGFDVDIKLQSTAIYDTEMGYEDEVFHPNKITSTHLAVFNFSQWHKSHVAYTQPSPLNQEK